MGNLIQIPSFHTDELSELANSFINNHRVDWSRFIVKVRIAVKEQNQDKLDEAIEKIAKYIDEEGGRPLWEELWAWVVKNNRRNNTNDARKI